MFLAILFLHYLPVDQLYAKEVYFCSFVTKSNQVSTSNSPDVFNSFYRTITHGESHRIFTSSPPPNIFSPHFIIEPLPSIASPFVSLQPSKPPSNDAQYFNLIIFLYLHFRKQLQQKQKF